ncbi:MAG: acetate--CoA ligase [Aquificaceae bacterium]|nr:acetate--CoA ligase [Aquificaceae bacterium]MDW8237182.1 acetate--CoA ligase [Aquificaceae bacterium]
MLKVNQKFYPPQRVLEMAKVKDFEALYKKSISDPEGFWSDVAKELFWFQDFDKVLEWNFPRAKWFLNGKTNISYNCLDRNLDAGLGEKIAYIVLDEDGNEEKITFGELHRAVSSFAKSLLSLGVKKGDRVCIYMPSSIEAIIAMLASARIGAVHSVVFAGFSAQALRTRIQDASAKVVITSSQIKRRGKNIDTLSTVLEAIKGLDFVEHIIVSGECPQNFISFESLLSSSLADASLMDSEDPLFILYTSGTTGKPKGIVHTTGGYMTAVYLSTKLTFDLGSDDVYFCTADVGWITGHSYVVYGPLLNGITSIIAKGAPDYPSIRRWFEIIERYRVNVFYTAPTAIRMFMRYGNEFLKGIDLSSLRVIGTVGEPINPEAWLWYYKNVGLERCAVVDTWWQTETGSHMITTIPSYPAKPGMAGKPYFGIEVKIVDEEGKELPPNTPGYLVINKPWPSMLRDCFNEPERYNQYFNSIPGNVYFSGDIAVCDEEGYIMILGRADDVLKIAGHRIGTMEVESALVSHPSVAESAVVGKPHDIKGEVIKAFVLLRQGYLPSEELSNELKNHVREVLGPIAVIEEIEFVDKLPKTRSGKIMRRVLRAIERGQDVGDTSTLED